MAAYFLAGKPVTLFIATVAVLLLAESALSGFPTTLTLERAFPTNHFVDLNELRHRDSFRHPTILQHSSSNSYVVTFPVQGAYDPFRSGLYYTRLHLGSPAKQYYMQIDTGSGVSWVSCKSCNSCPTFSGLQIPIQFYNPSTSSSASLISCSDQRCLLRIQPSNFVCSNSDHQCSYAFEYVDGSEASGYYVSDVVHLETTVGNSKTSSASIVFGCTTSRGGGLTNPAHAVDGLLGFNQQGISLISQLSSQGIAPNAFSHCLVGDGVGSGILVLGQLKEPNMVYTPLVASQNNYMINLLSISVDGQTLPIDPSVFAISSTRGGTTIDSGSALAYLPGEAYGPLMAVIMESVSQSIKPVMLRGHQCFQVFSSTPEKLFPTVSLNFEGGASLSLKPPEYLLQQSSMDGPLWCSGFQEMSYQAALTILGDLVLKDRIVVYDLGGQRIGWANYDCTRLVNVSTVEDVNAGSSSFQDESKKILMVVLLHLLVFDAFA